jgi:hypothetical protein
MKLAAAVTAVVVLVAVPALAPAQTCGSALLAEKSWPAAFQGITVGGGTVARMWALGQGSHSFTNTACLTGCTGFSSSPLCQGGGDCIAVTGVNWLNATCQTAGTRPATTVLLVETTTAADGGRWAALKLPSNETNANTDLDAVAASVCGASCASIASPLVGDAGQPIRVTSASLVGTTLTLELAWTAPSPAAQALNSGGGSLVTSYSIYVARSSGGNPPGMTGSTSGWTRVPDTDSTQTGGYSTNTAAKVGINTNNSSEGVYVAIGLNFDGTGNPTADSNTKASTYISRGVLVYTPSSAVPVVAGVSPSSGPTAGGTRVTVTGTGLGGATAATIGGAAVEALEPIDASTLLATSPAGSAGPATVAVTTPSGTGSAANAFTFLDLAPSALSVDATSGAGTVGNANGVLDPGETVLVTPSWDNLRTTSVTTTATADGFIGPMGATYSVVDATADYGTIASNETKSCQGDCYLLSISAPATRPRAHWDAAFEEILAGGERKTWALHVGASFADVPTTYWAYKFIETVLHTGITSGCDPGNYCPLTIVTRWQMAVFLAAALTGGPVPISGTVPNLGSYNCVAGGASVFGDVPPTDPGCKFIHYIAAKGITAGCGGGNYCPTQNLNRWQMAIFLAVALAGNNVPVSGIVPKMGPYNCVFGGQSVFGDVAPADAGCKFIHYIAAQGITAGCGGGNYCPSEFIKRDQMAVFLTAGFHLALYGP